MKDHINIGAWISNRRKGESITQTEFAKRCHCTRDMIKSIEIDRRKPSLDRFLLVCRILSVTGEEFEELIAHGSFDDSADDSITEHKQE